PSPSRRLDASSERSLVLQNVVNHIAIAERMEHLQRQAVEQRLRRQVRQARRAARRRALLWRPPEQETA
ncbi:MAG: hypothetical protein M3394_06815, partial [Actinomycetota bacterium]|nr:hypothetical protein [Actinomycetota bacterium]